MDLLNKLNKAKLISPPSFLPDVVMYVARTGSVSYGCSSDTSDEDFVGFCVPTINILFPSFAGELYGWDMQTKRFEQWQQHGIKFNDKVYDFNIYNIVKWFRLTADCNPNMVDSLFVRREDVIHSTQISELVRENRKLFLSKKAWHTYKGYAYAQAASLDKIPIGSRKELVDKYGFDVKYAYHIVRLVDEVEQILTLEDLDLHRAKEHMKAVRRGDLTKKDILEWFSVKEKELEKAYSNSKLPEKPREEELKQLLLKCIEIHYGSLDKYIVNTTKEHIILSKIANLVNGY